MVNAELKVHNCKNKKSLFTGTYSVNFYFG